VLRGRARAVEDNHGFQRRLVGFDEGAHAAEIAFTFFANVATKRMVRRGLIWDSWQARAMAMSAARPVRYRRFGRGGDHGRGGLLFRWRGKDGSRWAESTTISFSFVPRSSPITLPSCRFALRGGRARRSFTAAPAALLKWGGNFGQARLLLVYPGEIAGKPGQRGAHFGIVSELRARSRRLL